MSYDLWVLAGPLYSADAVHEAIALFVDEQAFDAFDQDPRLLELYDAVVARYPALEDLPDDEVGAWGASPERSDRTIAFPIRHPRVDEVATVVVKEAFDRGLFTFDPQDMTIYPPSGADPDRAVTSVRRET